MKQYIDKSTLVAEIERRKEINKYRDTNDSLFEDEAILSFLSTIEVKEVDLEKELESWRHNHFHGKRDREANGEYLKRDSQLDLAKHFFELGLNTQKGE